MEDTKVLGQVHRLLKQHRAFRRVVVIKNAKTPIVKFFHAKYQLEGDVSVYNTLVPTKKLIGVVLVCVLRVEPTQG